MQSNEGNELVFVIETCQNCKEHHWNTRHDEAKYTEFFNRGKVSDFTEDAATCQLAAGPPFSVCSV